MRTKLAVLLTASVMLTALGALEASPSFANDYFVKDLNSVFLSTNFPCPHLQSSATARHGRAVFRRTASSMFVTVYVTNAPQNHSFDVALVAQPGCTFVAQEATTDSNGNVTVRLGPLARKGKQSFYASGSPFSGTQYQTDLVPAFGF